MDTSEDYGTPRSGRKKKSLLAKMAQRKARSDEPIASQETITNGSKHSPSGSSLTHVSIYQSPCEDSRTDTNNSKVESQIQRKHVEGISDPRNIPKPVPRNRVRQSLDLSEGHWSKPPVHEEVSSPLLSSDDDVADSFEHKVQIHNERTRSTTTVDRQTPVPESGQVVNNASNVNDSDVDSDTTVLREEYQNVLSSTGSSTRPLELTEENLRRKESLENPLDTSFTRTNRLQRLNNMARVGNATPPSEMGSTRSFTTQASLPLITTKSVRERSFLVGSIGHSALLGVEELERLFPDRRLKVFVVTWNMYENKAENLPKSLDDILLPEDVEYVPDICVVNTQESCSNKREWEIRLQETIGPTHVLLMSVYHGSLHTCIFIRRDLIWYCSLPECDNLTFRPAVRTKGSLAVTFSVFGTSFLFLNSHFMPGDGRLDQRILDYKETIMKIRLPANPPKPFNKGALSDVSSRFDVTFWGGDMNFRIVRPRHIVDTIVGAIQEHQTHPDYEELLVGCELYRCKNEGLAFQRFQEGRINFPPTYKYDVNKEHLYDTSEKMRIPSYCDRILFRTRKKQGCECLFYSSIDSIKVSDHHPVCGLYEVELRPGKDSTRLASGRFNREVYAEANRRRAEYRAQPSDEKRSAVCLIS